MLLRLIIWISLIRSRVAWVKTVSYSSLNILEQVALLRWPELVNEWILFNFFVSLHIDLDWSLNLFKAGCWMTFKHLPTTFTIKILSTLKENNKCHLWGHAKGCARLLHLAREKVIIDFWGHHFIRKIQERNLGSLNHLNKVRAPVRCEGQGEAQVWGELRVETVWKRTARSTEMKFQDGSTKGRGMARQPGWWMKPPAMFQALYHQHLTACDYYQQESGSWMII